MRRAAILIGVFFLLSGLSQVYASDAVASLGKITGKVQVKVKSSGDTIFGREGLILKDGDVVVTGKNTNVSIVFREGSEIRLFQNTRFVIEKSIENKKRRSFKYKLKMNLGSFFGRFIKSRQSTNIQTPNATIGVKGTSIRVEHRKKQTSVGLSTGLVSIKNDDEAMDLRPGKMVEGIKKVGNFSRNVKDLSYRLSIKPDNKNIRFPDASKSIEIYFNIQLVNQATRQNFGKSGKIWLMSDLNKMVFPNGIKLNKRGFARVKATVNSLEKRDFRKGKAEVFVFMDEDRFKDIGAGQVSMPLFGFKGKRTFRVDTDSGDVKQR